MIIEQRVVVGAALERLWDFVTDVPAVSTCVPGAEGVTQTAEDTYHGALRVKVGPIALRLEGDLVLAQRDQETRLARIDVQAADKRVGGAVRGKMQLRLEPRGDNQTELAVHADVAILGKLGEFGQGVIRKKADQTIAEFARNLSAAVGEG
ncbi:MAG: SRPBCC family protein [Chloroflexi bacterium]|nr:SRPBCC family protein [Chloroflexota bacterium]